MTLDPLDPGNRASGLFWPLRLRCWICAGLLMLQWQPVHAADLIEGWNNALLDSIRAEDTPPCLAARNLAIVHGAIYDASVAASPLPARAEPFFFRTTAQPGVSAEAAMNSAALAAATFTHPSHRAQFEQLYQTLRGATPDEPAQHSGEILGRKVAQAWIEWRSSDGSSRSLTYVPKTEPGAWKRTPPFHRPPDLPAWCLVQPFTLIGSTQFRPPGPPSLDTSRYAEDLNAVQNWGGAHSTHRTPEQTETAKFWSDFSYSVTPPGHWNQIAQAVTARTDDLHQKARFFAILNIAMADAGIACWEAKFHFNFWRPITAIRNADLDSNSATEKDPQWAPLLITPSFPEYVSGHSAFSGAAAAILTSLLGTDAVDFSVPSDTLAGQRRSFQSFAACASEISQSRLYGGIHFPSSLRDGLALGQQIAQHVLTTFAPVGQPSTTVLTAPAELDPGYWLGAIARTGQTATIERLEQGEWNLYTNVPAVGPVIRWRTSELPAPDSLRIVFR